MQNPALVCTLLLSLAGSPAIRPTEHATPAAARGGLVWEPWYVLSPLDHPQGSAEVAPAHPPEEELAAMRVGGIGPDLKRRWDGKKQRKIGWELVFKGARPEAIVDTKKIDFLKLVPEDYTDAEKRGLTDNAVAYLYRRIECDREAQVPTTLGSDDGCRVWLNGELLHEFNGGRGVNPKSDAVTLDLKPGANHLFVKVNNAGGAWGFQMVPDIHLAPEDRNHAQPAINAAINRGVEYLLQTQQRDGSWGYHASPYRNGQTSLSLYALLKSGVRPEHQAVRRGLSYLRQRPPQRTYSVACQILALYSTNSEEHHPWLQELTDELVDWQRGSYAYPTGEPDLSNTQYGALGLWAAAKAGMKIPRRAWVDLARSALSYHNKDGGFGYRPGSASTGSMTVAGVTVISICADQFGEKGFPAQWKKPLERARADGLQWLGDNFSRDKNPKAPGGGGERWKHYYLYGLERLAALEGLELFGEHNWYWEGSVYLVGSQGEDGNWSTANGESEPNTCFGLLFLNRATASMTGAGPSPHQGRLYATDGRDAEIVLRGKGDTPMTLWLSEIRPEAAERVAIEGGRGRGIYVKSIEYFADGVSVATVEADPTRPWSSEPYAIQHRFEKRGKHQVQLVMHLVRDSATAGAEAGRLESPVMDVRVDELLEDWMLDYTDDGNSNLALGPRKTTEASSQRNGQGAAKAFDGFQSTAWVCTKGDPDPKLTVEFSKPLRVDRLLISHAAGTELAGQDFDQATKIEVNIGGKREPFVFDVNPDATLKTLIELPRKVKLDSLSVRVLERKRGSRYPGCVGFAEVEIRNGEERGARKPRR